MYPALYLDWVLKLVLPNSPRSCIRTALLTKAPNPVVSAANAGSLIVISGHAVHAAGAKRNENVALTGCPAAWGLTAKFPVALFEGTINFGPLRSRRPSKYAR